MDKATVFAVEWLERRYDDWRIRTSSEHGRLRFASVVNASEVADTPVGCWTPPMFSIKDDIGDRIAALRTEQEIENLYWCQRCSWQALIGGAYSHVCWMCSKRISHMQSAEVGQCEECCDRLEKNV